MKKLFLLLLITTCAVNLLAQKEKSINAADEPAAAKNVVKINLFAIALKNITLQYERAVAGKLP